MADSGSRLQQARELLESLLTDLETASLPISQNLMKAMRVARLLRDADAQAWLALEIAGYPQGYDSSNLGTCEKYAVAGGRIAADGRYWLHSLPEAEAGAFVTERTLQAIGPGPPLAPVENYLASGATMQVMERHNLHLANNRAEYVKAVAFLAAMKTALHSYATDAYLALEFGFMVEDLFTAARSSVDAFVRANCPRAAESLVAINERLSEGDRESRSASLTSCRRLLQAVADSVFPAQETAYIDLQGKSHDVGSLQYKNRLLAFLDRSVDSRGSYSILASEVEHVSKRLDAVYEKACKGVHEDVSPEEARLAVMSTYLVLAEIARAGTSTA